MRSIIGRALEEKDTMMVLLKGDNYWITNSMKGDYWLYSSYIRPSWCDYIVEYATENYEPRDAVIGFEDAKFDESYRKSEIRWLNAKTENAITKEIWHCANQANRDHFFDLDLRYVNEIQFTKYIGDPTIWKV